MKRMSHNFVGTSKLFTLCGTNSAQRQQHTCLRFHISHMRMICTLCRSWHMNQAGLLSQIYNIIQPQTTSIHVNMYIFHPIVIFWFVFENLGCIMIFLTKENFENSCVSVSLFFWIQLFRSFPGDLHAHKLAILNNNNNNNTLMFLFKQCNRVLIPTEG